VSVAAIYQQIGRAGRGSSKADAFILFDNCGIKDDSLSPDDCRLQTFFLKSSLCDSAEVELILAKLRKQKTGITVDTLCSKVNIEPEKIKKTLMYLECENYVRTTSLNKWEYVENLDKTKYDQYISEIEEGKSDEWSNIVFQFVAGDLSCLMHQLTSAMGDSTNYRCNQCSVCESLQLNDQQGSEPSYSFANVKQSLLKDARCHVKSSARPLTLRKDLRLDVYHKYDLKSNDFEEAKEGRVLSLWQDGGFGDILKDWTFGSASQFDEDMNSLVNWAVEMYNKWAPNPVPLWVTFVPSAGHPLIPKLFSELFAKQIRLPLKEVFTVDESSEPQKQSKMQNDFFRCQNIDGLYNINAGEITKGSPVILIDYVVASGCTISTVAALLRHEGSGPVFPLALTKKRF